MANRVFVTGEAGSLASHLIQKLQERGDILLNESLHFNKSKCTPWSRVDEINILKSANIAMLRVKEPDIIFHLAGLVGTPRCAENPELAVRSNIETTVSIAKLHKPGQKIVYFGTTVMHDTKQPRPFNEDTPIKAETIYGLTKYTGEEILRLMIPKKDLLIIRPCFVYGGKYDHASVITTLIRTKLFENNDIIEVPLNVDNLKDYYYIDDFMGDLFKLIDAGAYGTYNLAKGTPTNFGYVVAELDKRDLLPKNVRLEPSKDYLGDHYVIDNKARAIIGPTKKTELGDGIDLIVKELLHGPD